MSRYETELADGSLPEPDEWFKIVTLRRGFRKDHYKRAQWGGGEARLTWEQWEEICTAHDWRCIYCRRRPLIPDCLQVEHLVPLSKGGDHSAHNVRPSCPTCNYEKWTHSVDEYMSRREAAA